MQKKNANISHDDALQLERQQNASLTSPFYPRVLNEVPNATADSLQLTAVIARCNLTQLCYCLSISTVTGVSFLLLGMGGVQQVHPQQIFASAPCGQRGSFLQSSARLARNAHFKLWVCTKTRHKHTTSTLLYTL